MRYVKLSRKIILALLTAKAMTPPTKAADTTPVTATNDLGRLPVVTVTAEKFPEPVDTAPLSVTPVTRGMIRDSGVRTPEDAAIYSPNNYFTDFAPRKNSSPRFRGIGGTPISPAVTTYIDGVPQLNSNSSNQELVDIDQVEFVRGAESTLFGRNTIGGVISTTSIRPSNVWTGGVDGQYGNYNLHDVRGNVSGPILPDQLSFSLAGGYSERDGYSKSITTGDDIDFRQGSFGKGQLFYSPFSNWEVRLIISGESDHDGDYPLGDLAFIRANPHKVNPAFEGFADRDIVSPTLQLHHGGAAVDFTSIAGVVWWKTLDITDLNYAGLFGGANIPRKNQEEDFQFTEELRFASSKDAPIKLGENAELGWQAGGLVFSQNYQQQVAYSFPAFFGIPPNDNHADLDDFGVGAYGEGTGTLFEKLDLTAGVRVDYEGKNAAYNFATAVPAASSLSKDFISASPHFAVAYHFHEKHTFYGEVTRGYRSGGYNNATPATPPTAAFDEEHSWDYEAGYKGSFLDERLKFRAAGFYIDWRNLQLSTLVGPGQVFISNTDANSKGFELEMSARPARGLDLFAGLGYVDVHYASGATDNGIAVGGNRLQYTPDYTINAGAQYSHELTKGITAYARGEVNVYGGFPYDSENSVSQEAYSIANFRAGVRGRHWFAEGWIRNAFDTDYVPIVIAYTGLAPSGFVGESGAPMTFGLKAGASF